MRLKLLALCVLPAAVVVFAAAAQADSGTFSGSITPNDCGPLHPINVTAGETTIDVAAAETVSANDITLELFDPAGNHVAHGVTRSRARSRSTTRAPTFRPEPGTPRSARSRAAS